MIHGIVALSDALDDTSFTHTSFTISSIHICAIGIDQKLSCPFTFSIPSVNYTVIKIPGGIAHSRMLILIYSSRLVVVLCPYLAICAY